MRHLLVLLTVVAFSGCKDDLCKSQAPAFELEVVLGAGTPSSSVSQLLVEVVTVGKTKTATFDAGPLQAKGRATLTVLVGDEGRGGFQVQVAVKALSSTGAAVASVARSFAGSGDACNYFSLVLGSQAEAGGDLRPDSTCPAPLTDCGGSCVDLLNHNGNCGVCGNVCATSEPCVAGGCRIFVSGTLSGLLSYPGKRVVIDKNVTVTPYNGTDSLDDGCGVGETGCLRVMAQHIVVSAGVTIDATGSGGGGGGGGGGSVGYTGPGSCNVSACSGCTAGAAGRGTHGGASGQAGGVSISGTTGGGGGKGAGPFGGVGGAGTSSEDSQCLNPGPALGVPGGAGGYGAAGVNGDTTTTESIWVGSGGAGGSGGACAVETYYSSVGGSGGGGAGNAGGGMILLEATRSIAVEGTIKADGLDAKTGNGGSGTDGDKGGTVKCDLPGSGGGGGNADETGSSSGGTSPKGYWVAGTEVCLGGSTKTCSDYGSTGIAGATGGKGGAGSGGGILLKAPSVALSGTIQSKGGTATNGGTVKVFYQGTRPTESGISGGRVLVTSY
jgi:hypothetical protein